HFDAGELLELLDQQLVFFNMRGVVEAPEPERLTAQVGGGPVGSACKILRGRRGREQILSAHSGQTECRARRQHTSAYQKITPSQVGSHVHYLSLFELRMPFAAAEHTSVIRASIAICAWFECCGVPGKPSTLLLPVARTRPA